MSGIRYNLLAILGGLILVGYGILGTIGGGQVRMYQSALLMVGLAVAVILVFHLGTQWAKKKNDSRRRF